MSVLRPTQGQSGEVDGAAVRAKASFIPGPDLEPINGAGNQSVDRYSVGLTEDTD